MSKLKIQAGTLSKLMHIFVPNSSVTTGAGLTGLTGTGSSITWYYLKEGAGATVAVSMSNGTLGSYSSGSFVAVDAVNMPGVYEIGVPNAALSSAQSVIMYLQGATNMAPVILEIELDAVNYQSASAFITGVNGNTNVTANVIQWSSGNVPSPNVTGVPLIDLKYTLGTISPATAGSVRADAVTGAVGSVTGNVGGSVASVTAAVTVGAYSGGTSPDTLVFAHVVETGITMQQLMEAVGAACAGVLAGAGTSTVTIQAIGNSGTQRISAAVDASGDRTSVTLSL